MDVQVFLPRRLFLIVLRLEEGYFGFGVLDELGQLLLVEVGFGGRGDGLLVGGNGLLSTILAGIKFVQRGVTLGRPLMQLEP